MKLLADESVDAPVVEFLRNTGFDIIYVLERKPGVSDSYVLEWSIRTKRVLLTVDKDFGELIFRTGKASVGVVLYRLSGIPNSAKSKIILRVLQERNNELIRAFTVITRHRIRIRKLL
jgi:predicted nuclease of predicted toxin-antitoxin system